MCATFLYSATSSSLIQFVNKFAIYSRVAPREFLIGCMGIPPGPADLLFLCIFPCLFSNCVTFICSCVFAFKEFYVFHGCLNLDPPINLPVSLHLFSQ